MISENPADTKSRSANRARLDSSQILRDLNQLVDEISHSNLRTLRLVRHALIDQGAWDDRPFFKLLKSAINQYIRSLQP